MVVQRSIPAKLYKYHYNLDYLKEVLFENKIYFSSPSDFNDPYDSRPTVTTGNINKAISRDLTDRLKLRTDRFGFYCMSEINDNLLMWSHYAKGHTGYCLEFSTESPKSFFGYVLRMEYQNNNPFVQAPRPDDGEQLFEAMKIKSPQWKYEKEWRIPSDEPGHVNFPPDALKAVILGCNMEQKIIEKILSWNSTRKKPVRLKRAVLPFPYPADRRVEIVDLDPGTRR